MCQCGASNIPEVDCGPIAPSQPRRGQTYEVNGEVPKVAVEVLCVLEDYLDGYCGYLRHMSTDFHELYIEGSEEVIQKASKVITQCFKECSENGSPTLELIKDEEVEKKTCRGFCVEMCRGDQCKTKDGKTSATPEKGSDESNSKDEKKNKPPKKASKELPKEPSNEEKKSE